MKKGARRGSGNGKKRNLMKRGIKFVFVMQIGARAEKWKGQETAGYEIDPSLSLNPISNSSTSPSSRRGDPAILLKKKNPDSFLLITSGTTADRQTEHTPGILIKRNPNPPPVLELNPVSLL